MSTGSAAPNGYAFDPGILREYDIRGEIGKTLSEDDAYALGRAFGTFVARQDGKKVCVGYDGRHSSPGLARALCDGLQHSGINVEFIGLGPTPMLYFAVKHREADGGIMVTGSHNPPDYNGFKMTLLKEPVFGETIQKIGRLSAAGDFESGEGSKKKVDIKAEYVARLLKDLTLDRPLKVAWDNGNGAAGEILQMLVEKLPGEHVLLYEVINGDFPNHHPDPTVDKNLADLQKTVTEQNCDLGVAFDGDGDRIGVVDEQGRVLRCDILMTLYAKEVLAAFPGAPVIGDVKCSSVMFEEIERLGGRAIMWKTGHSLIKDKMAETSAPLAGELSGHIFFADKYYGFDDALYCAIRLFNAMNETDGPLSALTEHLPVLHSTAEVRFEVDEETKFDLVPQVAEALKNRDDNDNFEVSDIDGVRVSTRDGWWLLRPSNTQNVLVARAEGKSAEGLERLKTMAKDAVKEIGYTLNFEEA